MLKLNPTLLLVAVLLVASLACIQSVPVVPTTDPSVISTIVAQTIVAAQTQTGQSIIPITGLTSPTATSALPTLTATATLSPTPIFTPTPLIPQISVSVATNCRAGPGKIYDRVGALLVGETADVVGHDPTSNYWYIRNPDKPNDFCWLWGEYATLSGNYAVLPVFTPPPTPVPAPSFTASYDGRDTCNGWWIDIALKNTGGTAFRSLSLVVKDMATGDTLSLSSNGFTDRDSCVDTYTEDILSPDHIVIASSPTFDHDPHGNKVRATITLCSDKGLNGTCVTDTITIAP